MKQTQAFTIIYEDDFIVGVNKTWGIAVSPDRWDGSKDRLDRLLSGFLAEQGERAAGRPEDPPPAEDPPFPGRIFTVHRIDRDTSGLVVFAKDAETHRNLSGAFEARRVEKRYIAVVHGRPSWTETSCDLPLVPDGDKQHRTIIDKYRGKESLTRFRFLGGTGNYGVVEAIPATGRTHQIRVHLASLGHPIVCDPLYGSINPVYLSSFKRGWRGDPQEERPLLSRLGLHAGTLILPDYRPAPDATVPPGDAAGGGLTLHAPLAKDMAALLKQMGKCAGRDFL
ncbi:MAG: RNA pseudouridine synthase [Treponema sp.]|jgi:RluA family pseudouridine synthase|nr:RNA pseudouridine synthase [Treponema sp.]